MTSIPIFALFVGFFAANYAIDDEPIIFTKTKYIYQEGEKSKDKKLRFRFEEGILIIHDEKTPEKSKKFKFEIPYENIKEITYERSKHPRAKTAIFLSPFALFSKGKKHWLYLTTTEDTKLFQMDKKEYQGLLMALESRTGIEIERIIEQ